MIMKEIERAGTFRRVCKIKLLKGREGYQVAALYAGMRNTLEFHPYHADLRTRRTVNAVRVHTWIRISGTGIDGRSFRRSRLLREPLTMRSIPSVPSGFATAQKILSARFNPTALMYSSLKINLSAIERKRKKGQAGASWPTRHQATASTVQKFKR